MAISVRIGNVVKESNDHVFPKKYTVFFEMYKKDTLTNYYVSNPAQEDVFILLFFVLFIFFSKKKTKNKTINKFSLKILILFRF